MKYLKYFKTKSDYESFVRDEDLPFMICYVSEDRSLTRFSKYNFFETKNGIFTAKDGAFNLKK